MNDLKELEERYRSRHEQLLKKLAYRLEDQLKDHLENMPRIDRISARAKSVDRFIEKAAVEVDGQRKYSEPLKDIQDQLGARIVTFYLDDVEPVSEEIEAYYNNIEAQVIEPESENEFSYFGKHYVLHLQEDLLGDDLCQFEAPKFFELQIKTLFQHAWSEANHDLGYKPQSQLTLEDKREIAFTAAQAWGADRIFSGLFKAKKNRCSR